MDDQDILGLYLRREEAAITETDRKYGPLCRRVAMNILSVREDAEECVNDTWLAAWEQIPPQRPRSLGAFLGRITRNPSVSRFRANHAKKRYDGMEVLLSELDDCVPAPGGVEQALDRALLGQLISAWLDTLDPGDRDLFVRRYWYGDAVRDLARDLCRAPNQISQRLLRLRRTLRTVLEQEGVNV